MDSEIDVQDLELQSLIGFDGNPLNGLILHPDGIHLIYPLGSNIIAYDLSTKKQRFYEGHSNKISAVAISKSGKYIAASQVNYMGFKSPIIVWDFMTSKMITKYEAHKVRVESIAFSCCENYLLSLGGLDDESITVYDVEKLEVLSGSSTVKSSAGLSTVIKPIHSRNDCFIVTGDNIFKLWTVNKEQRNVQGIDTSFAKIKRKILCTEIGHLDDYAYCGTSTGDMIKIKLNIPSDVNATPLTPTLVGCYAKYPAITKKRGSVTVELYSKGITSLYLAADCTIIVGSGGGVVELVKQKVENCKKNKYLETVLTTPTHPLLVTLKTANVGSFVTSIQMMKNTLFIGTMNCELFSINTDDFCVVRMFTCHTSVINGLAFPYNYSKVFATTSKNDVRIWSVETLQELLRITVKNLICAGVIFTFDGSQIITSWSDGKIRSFTPETGRMVYTIHNCHNNGVTAISMTRDGKKLLSGGGDGQVRVWQVGNLIGTLLAVLKEHKGSVSSIDVHRLGHEAISSSSDGTCVVWDIVRYTRLSIMFSSTVFTCAKYHPNDAQLLTCGTNRQIGFWESIDGSLIREIEGSPASSLNSLDVTPNGKYVVTGSADQLIKVWLYNEGTTTHVGVGHAGVVTNVKVSPDGRVVVSTSVDGGIFLWRFPKDNDDDAAAIAEGASSTPTTGHGSRGGSSSHSSMCRETREQQQTARSRLLSQKKTLPKREENINTISKARKSEAKTYSADGAAGDAGGGGGNTASARGDLKNHRASAAGNNDLNTPVEGGGSVRCLCPRGTTCNCGDANSVGSRNSARHAVA